MTTTDRPATAPLSHQQDEMVRNFHDYPDCVDRYDFVCLFRLDGPVDRDCLAGALDDLVLRHAALRTVIRPHRDGYVQQIHAAPLLPVADHRGPGRNAAELARALLAERLGPDAVLAGAPLFRPRTHRLADGLYLSFSVHHMVYDGWSLSVLWRDLSECYAARAQRRTPDLPPIGLTYADFAGEQRAATPALLPQAVAFWREAADGMPCQVAWPQQAGTAAAEAPLVLGHVPLPVPPQTVRRVRTTARQAKVSPAAVLLGATAVGAARTTGQRSLLFGTDTANREDRRKKHLVGHCVNARLTAVRLEPGVPFTQVVRGIADQWAAAEPYRDVYSDLILQGLGLSRMFKVNLAAGLVSARDAPVFGDTGAVPVPVPAVIRDWRPLHVVWNVAAAGIDARLNHQRAGVDRALVQEFGRQVLQVLDDPATAV